MIDIDILSTAKGFQLSQEPFFQSMIRAKAISEISKDNCVSLMISSSEKKLASQTIPLPANRGRTLFGVVDNTGLLGHNQVFIQVTKSVNGMPTKNSPKDVITGDRERELPDKNLCRTRSGDEESLSGSWRCSSIRSS